MTSTTVTTGRFGRLHPRPNREAYRWVSRPHRASSPHQFLPVRFVQPIVVDDSFNRLKPRAISGGITTTSRTGACDMQSTETESDSVFAHANAHSGPCAVLPPDSDVPRRTDRGHFMIAPDTSPAPTASDGRETSDYPPLSHSRSRASSIVHRLQDSGSHSPPYRWNTFLHNFDYYVTHAFRSFGRSREHTGADKCTMKLSSPRSVVSH